MADDSVHVTAAAVDIDWTDQIAEGTSELYSLDCNDIEVTSGVEGKSIIITSDEDVQVEAIANADYGDSYLVLPVHPASTEFVTAAYFDPGSTESFSTMVIAVASEPDTTVKFYRLVLMFIIPST